MALIVAAAIISDGRLLAARRNRGPFAGLWELPGGKVDKDEEERSALARELLEELGVTGTIGDQLGGDWPLQGIDVMHVYRVDLNPGMQPRCLDGHDALRWLPGSETPSVSWIPADLPIVAAIAELLRA